LDWEPKHVTIDLFEAKNIILIKIASQLQTLFEECKLTNKIICYVKDESTNLFTMTYVLKQISNCEELGILAPLNVFVLAMPFLKLANMPFLMRR
jgi:hypothetical protein